MRGSVKKYEGTRGTSWYYVIDAGADADGRRSQKKRRGFSSKKAAETAMRQELHERTTGAFVEPNKTTLGELFEQWLRVVAAPKVKATTLAGYQDTIAVHIVPHLGSLPVQRLTPLEIQSFYADRRAAGVSPRTLLLVHQRLSQALAVAVRWGMATRNVMEAVERPQVRHASGKTWTPAEAAQFLAVADKDRLAGLWRLLLTTGVRRGEALGVRWQDLDLERRTMTVAQSVVQLRGKPSIQPPKTEAAQRTIRLDDETTTALVEHRKRQIERRLAAPCWEDHDLVFCTENGRPLGPNNVLRAFGRLTAAAGVPRIRLHDTRHTHISWLLTSGKPIHEVSRHAGHARTSITLDAYSHIIANREDDASSVVAKLLARERTPSDGVDRSPAPNEEKAGVDRPADDEPGRLRAG